jgi:Translocon-associated protein, gamma subunit (TRAP-gamma)
LRTRAQIKSTIFNDASSLRKSIKIPKKKKKKKKLEKGSEKKNRHHAKMAKTRGGKKQETEEDIDQVFKKFQRKSASSSASPSLNERIVFLLFGWFSAAVPVYLYQTVFEMSVEHFAIYYALVTLVGGVIIHFAYQNVSYRIRNQLHSTRDFRVSGDAEQQEAKLGKIDALAVKEAAAYSILYNNVFFLLLTVLCGFVFFSNHAGPANYTLSVISSALALLFISGGAMK